MLQRLEFSRKGTETVGIAEVGSEFLGEAGVGLKELIVGSLEMRFEPREGGTTKVGSGEHDLGAVIRKQVGVAANVQVQVGDEGGAGLAILSIELGWLLESLAQVSKVVGNRRDGYYLGRYGWLLDLGLQVVNQVQEVFDLALKVVNDLVLSNRVLVVLELHFGRVVRLLLSDLA